MPPGLPWSPRARVISATERQSMQEEQADPPHVFVVGGGAREHAIAWALHQSPQSPRITCAPGNAGIAAIGTCVDISAEDIDALLAWAKEHTPDLVVVGPEG